MITMKHSNNYGRSVDNWNSNNRNHSFDNNNFRYSLFREVAPLFVGLIVLARGGMWIYTRLKAK
jgi:hypothetical protein